MKSKIARALASLVLALSLCFVPTIAAKEIGSPKGLDGKVYKASYALYATSAQAGVNIPRFLCTVTAFQKFQDGYLLIGAGHCTSANIGSLPPDLKYYIESDINTTPQPIVLLKAVMDDAHSLDYAVYFLKTKDKLETVDLGDEGSLKIGDKVVDVNFSLALSKEVSHGVVASKVVQSGEMKGFYGVDMFDSHGASGSSVVSEDSKKIVGLVIAGIDGATLPTWVEPISVINVELAKTDFAKLIANPETPKAQSPQDRSIPLWN